MHISQGMCVIENTNRDYFMDRSDPRQDPLLGPLLAELDAMTNQQVPSTSNYRHNSVPYESNFVRPPSFGKFFFFLLT
jgi:hypothetical protein